MTGTWKKSTLTAEKHRENTTQR